MNVDVFREGFDCPDVEFVQLARPTLSLAKYLQQVGRGLRSSEGKEACMLIDNVCLLYTSPYQFPEKLIPLFINNIRHGKPLPVYGRGCLLYTSRCV